MIEPSSSAVGERPTPPPPAGASWASQAFGMSLTGDFTAPGLARGLPAHAGLPTVRVRLAAREELEAAWPADGSERLLNWRFRNGETVMAIDRHPDAGYRLEAIRQGVHVLAADGSEIRSAVDGCETWIWQRYLTGQVLPLAAVLHGHEVLHASAVVVGDVGVGFVAESGVGKTSLALNLVLRGAAFLADDVAAVELVDSVPTVHPGVRLTNLRHAENEVMGTRRGLLGEVIGADDDGLRLVLRGVGRAAPLGALYFLERASTGGDPGFERLHDLRFDSLLSSQFTRFLSTPERLRSQLEVYSAIANRVPVFRLRMPAGMSAAELSTRVEAHVRDEI